MNEQKKSTINLDDIDYKELLQNSLLTGFAIQELIYDENHKAVDYKFLFVSNGFGELTGVKNAVGRTIKEIRPQVESYWLENYQHVVDNNTEMKFEGFSALINNTYIVKAKSLGRDNLFVSSFIDITENIRNHVLLRSTLASVGYAVVVFRVDGNIYYINKSAEELLNEKSENIINKNIDEVLKIKNTKTQTNNSKHFKKLNKEKYFNKKKHFGVGELILEVEDKQIPVTMSTAPITDNNAVIGIAVTIRDATKQKEAQDRVNFLINHDYLTNIGNRYHFESQLEKMEAEQLYPLSLIMGDVNGLKLINDAFGHERGDEHLKKVANVLKTAARPRDAIARIGGDEFVILLPKTSKKEVYKVYSKIQLLCNDDSADFMKISVALGHATKENSNSRIELLKEAEEQMYRTKLQQGKSFRSALIDSLETTLVEKSLETEKHAQNMIDIGEDFARKLGLAQHEIDKITLVARLHDIGKIAIDENILNKQKELEDEDWLEVKKHSAIGYRILNSITELKHIAYEVLCHHERYDGSGYPNGLKGLEIPIVSRIISVLDAYEVMTNGRSYKKPRTKQEAIVEIERCSGTQFDPEIAKIFIKCLEKY